MFEENKDEDKSVKIVQLFLKNLINCSNCIPEYQDFSLAKNDLVRKMDNSSVFVFKIPNLLCIGSYDAF